MSFFLFILLSAIVFSGIICLLVAALSLVETKVVGREECRICINDEKAPVVVPGGKSLLASLAEQKIFLPSACGGKGTCSTCKCRVQEGGGDVLPTETSQLTRKEIREGYRLSCQVKVRQDLKISIPPEVFKAREYVCRVRSNRNVATFIKELVLELPEPLDFRPGQYIQVNVPPYQLRYSDFDIEAPFRPNWDKYRIWDLMAENEETVSRAYSIANAPAEQGIIILNVRIATPPPGNMTLPPGIASSYIFNLKAGDKVSITGPFGEFLIRDSEREMVYVGGGAGMAPLRSHLFHLLRTPKNGGRKISFWYGARSRQEMFYTEDFRELEKGFPSFSYHVALSAPLPEDRWDGYAGLIHQVVHDRYLKDKGEPEEIEYYLCGPSVMIRAVLTMLDSLGVPRELVAFDDFG